MSLIIKLFAFIAALALAGIFVLKDSNGQPFLNIDDLISKKSAITSSIEQVLPEQVFGTGNEKTIVYRWKDTNGNWQFADKAPNSAVAEQVLLDTHLNSDIAPPAPSTKTSAAAEHSSDRAVFIGDSDTNPTIGTTVSPDKVEQLINDANNIQSLMDDRDQQLQEALKQ